MDRAEVQRWIAGFEAIAAADREWLRRRGPDRPWAIALALSMIDVARRTGQRHPESGPTGDAEVEQVRATWARLRERWRR